MKPYLHKVYVLLIIILFFNLSACKRDNQEPVVQPPKVLDPTALAITGITPDNGVSGTQVTITGTGFSKVLIENVVTLNDKKCTVTDASSTSLKITIPVKAGSGTIIVSVNGKNTQSARFSYEPQLMVSTFAGSGETGYTDGPAMQAKFNAPAGIAIGKDGTLYIADYGNYRIRKISPDGLVSTLAGSTYGSANGTGTEARFKTLVSLVVADDGTLFVTDRANHNIRKITSDGVVSVFAGCCGNGDIGYSGYIDGQGTEAKFSGVNAIAIAADGTLFVTDLENYKLRKISPDGLVSTLAGSTRGFADGIGSDAMFFELRGITIDKDNNLYVPEVAEYGMHKIRKIAPDGTVSTIYNSSGLAREARLGDPSGMAIGSDGSVYVADPYVMDSQANVSHQIRKISTDGIISKFVGNAFGYLDGPANIARFNHPRGIAIAADGTMYVADMLNNRIRRVAWE